MFNAYKPIKGLQFSHKKKNGNFNIYDLITFNWTIPSIQLKQINSSQPDIYN